MFASLHTEKRMCQCLLCISLNMTKHWLAKHYAERGGGPWGTAYVQATADEILLEKAVHIYMKLQLKEHSVGEGRVYCTSIYICFSKVFCLIQVSSPKFCMHCPPQYYIKWLFFVGYALNWVVPVPWLIHCQMMWMWEEILLIIIMILHSVQGTRWRPNIILFVMFVGRFSQL